MVKYLNKKYGLKNILLHAYLQKITCDSNIDRLVEILPNCYVPLPPDDRPVHDDCDADIHPLSRYTKHPMKRGKTEDKSKRFKSAYENADTEDFPVEVLIQSYLTQLATAPLLAVYQDVFKGIKYRAPVKGSPAYNHQKANNLKFVAEYYAKKYKYVYFITNTYSPKKHGIDRVFAWQYLREEMNRIQKALVRKYGIKYITIFESTTKQYPHAHSIIFSDHPLTGESAPTKKPVKVKYGAFYNKVKSLTTSPIFDIRRACNDNLAGYVLKYVSKTFSKGELPDLAKATSLSSKEKKALGSMIWPCIAGIRSFSHSKLPRGVKPVEVKPERTLTLIEQWALDVEKQYAKLDIQEQVLLAARRAAYLIDFRIKSHEICKKRVFMLPARHITETESILTGKTFASRRLVFREKTVFAKPMGCPGCLFETAYNMYWDNPERFKANFPKDPWFDFRSVITDPADDIHEKTARIDWNLTFTRTHLNQYRPVAGYTKKMQRDDRWQLADFLKQHRRETQKLAFGALFFGKNRIIQTKGV